MLRSLTRGDRLLHGFKQRHALIPPPFQSYVAMNRLCFPCLTSKKIKKTGMANSRGWRLSVMPYLQQWLSALWWHLTFANHMRFLVFGSGTSGGVCHSSLSLRCFNAAGSHAVCCQSLQASPEALLTQDHPFVYNDIRKQSFLSIDFA